MALEQYRRLPEEENKKNKGYARNRYCNLS